ncbi:transmembrane domain protein [Cryptosporidium xiaoi]|uniref:Transmembrane domain protein n=1 Tax=Cryptosporidium xiaoi TaxID=659607 RepID=A0AAV9XUX7_9CRYT
MEQKREHYIYDQPATSSFYDNVISPLCDHIVDNYLPKWLTPNVISISGLVFVTTSFLILNTVDIRREYYIISSILWFFYGIFDNLDGKQARKLGVSSNSGEFLDHAIDSLVTSMVGISFQLMHNKYLNYDILVVLSYQLPFYFACWFHYSYGKLILGNSISNKPYFTVDELNLFFIPLFILFEYTLPGLWRYDIKLPYFNNIIIRNWGVPFNYCCFLYSIFNQVLCIIPSLYNSYLNSHYFIIPIVIYISLKEYFNINIYFTIIPFSMLCITFIFLKISKMIVNKVHLSIFMLIASSSIPIISTKLLLTSLCSSQDYAQLGSFAVYIVQFSIWSILIYKYSDYLEKQVKKKFK